MSFTFYEATVNPELKVNIQGRAQDEGNSRTI